MKIGETLEWNGVVYVITKKIDDYSYEIQNSETGDVLPYAVGRPIADETL